MRVWLVFLLGIVPYSTALDFPRSVVLLEERRNEVIHLRSSIDALIARNKQQHQRSLEEKLVIDAPNNDECQPCDPVEEIAEMNVVSSSETKKNKWIDSIFVGLLQLFGRKNGGPSFFSLLINALLRLLVRDEEIPMDDFVSNLEQTLDRMTPIMASIEQGSAMVLSSKSDDSSIFVADAYGLVGSILDLIFGFIQAIVGSIVGVISSFASLFSSIIISILNIINGIYMTIVQSIVNILSIILGTRRDSNFTQKAYSTKINKLKEENVRQFSNLSKVLSDIKEEITDTDTFGLSEVLMATESHMDDVSLQYFAFLDSSVSMREAVISSDAISDNVNALIPNIIGIILRSSKLKSISR